MPGGRLVTVYGTVMATRTDGRSVVHHVEATGPDGGHLDLVVRSRSPHRGSVRVAWDPDDVLQPRFRVGAPWGLIGLGVLVAAAIVGMGWLFLG
jgi:hypothetical protein